MNMQELSQKWEHILQKSLFIQQIFIFTYRAPSNLIQFY